MDSYRYLISGQPHDTQTLLLSYAGASYRPLVKGTTGLRCQDAFVWTCPLTLPPLPCHQGPQGHLRDSGFDPSIHLEYVAKPRQT